MFRASGSAALCAALMMILSGCDGGSSSGGSAATGGGVVSTTPSPTPVAFTDGDAARLAKQASFGPTPALVAKIKELGVNGWLDEQFAATGSTYADLAANPALGNACSGITDSTAATVCNRPHFSRTPVAMRFYADALMAPDQLRQRVAWALSEMIVASEAEVNRSAGIAAFNQIEQGMAIHDDEVWPDRAPDLRHNLERQAHPIFNRTAPAVGALIGARA